jgi:4-hydroxybenzoate polyprenyltransferase
MTPFWLLRGKAWLKAQIAQHTKLSPRRLPLSPEFKEFLEQQQGRQIILATASNEKFAAEIMHQFKFDDYMASTDTINLAGTTKREHLIAKYGEKGFDYAGDSDVDIPVWQAANKAILVNANASTERRLSKHLHFDHIFDRFNPSRINYLKAMRVHQWLKNLLIFVPLLVAHQLDDTVAMLQTVLAFFAFSLCASSVYILNDLFDLPDDRLHPNKRHRPIASGKIPIKHALFMIPALLIASATLATFLPWHLGAVLATYYSLTLLYSIYLKSVAMLDVQVLATFYTLRLIAGAAVIAVQPSFWLLAFSMSLFLSLAIAKRYTGLQVRKEAGQKPASRRGYEVSDMSILQSFGIASGYISVLVLALYINSADVYAGYNNPMALWLLCPTVLFWIGRLWVQVHRGRMHDDPLVFAVTDRTSLLTGALMIIIMYFAI